MTRKAKGVERRANTFHASRPTPHATLDFHADLFARVFGEPFTARIKDRLRLRAVQRQIEDAADAASQWLARFFKNRKLGAKEAQAILKGWARGAFEIHFPKRFTLWLKALRLLPYRAYFYLVERATQ